MAELHEALSYLSPVAWEDVPTSSSSSAGELHKYTQDIFKKARLIIETVPEQNPGASLSDVNVSFTAIQLDLLRKEWGKPIKMNNNAKENPLNIPVYKLAGKDGKGAWFARRSVHKGLPFTRWKSKMQAEMEETLKARQEERKQGRTPNSSIRGIGGDRIVEKADIRDPNTNEILGDLRVYELSAQFPGPTTPRDFVTLIITSDAMLNKGADDEISLPPTYMIISKPCQHPVAPKRDDYIRGQYESVEVIRELPIENSTKGELDLDLDGESRSVPDDDPNPVEWIMVTRSDPGGSVPRWMVERGTPKSITGDAVKFLNWASKPDLPSDGAIADIGEMTESLKKEERERGVVDRENDVERLDQSSIGAEISDSGEEQQKDGGLWSSVSKLVHNGLQDYAPNVVLNYIPGRLSPSLGEVKDIDDGLRANGKKEQVDASTGDDDISSIASNDSFVSAGTHAFPSTSSPQIDGKASSETALATAGITSDTAKAKPSQKEKELAKLNTQKREIDVKLADIQQEIRKLCGMRKQDDKSAKVDNINSKDSTMMSMESSTDNKNDGGNAQIVVAAQDQKRIDQLSKTESKLISRLKKVEEQQFKVIRKIEADQRKAADRDEKMRSKSEIDNLRKEIVSLQQEVSELRDERMKWLDIVSRLQKENTAMMGQVQSRTLGRDMNPSGYGTD